jgi:hypothetical protein
MGFYLVALIVLFDRRDSLVLSTLPFVDVSTIIDEPTAIFPCLLLPVIKQSLIIHDNDVKESSWPHTI